MRVLGVITARGGSHRLPGKNLADLGGKPLIAWSIEVGLATCAKVVTTTDSLMIADAAIEYGSCVVMRPDHLVAGEPGMQMQAILHALKDITALHGEFDAVLLLQPTSPFREVEDVTACLRIMEDGYADSVVSVVEFPSRNTVFKVGHAGRLRDIVETMKNPGWNDALNLYTPNGAIYLARTAHLLSGGDWYGSHAYGYVMPPERSVDIDTHTDMDAARSMLKEKEQA